MEDVDYWGKPVDQSTIPVPIFLETVCCFLKKVKDIIGRVAALKLVGEWIMTDIYPCVVGIVCESFGDQVKVRRRDCCRGHGSRIFGWRSVRAVRTLRDIWVAVMRVNSPMALDNSEALPRVFLWRILYLDEAQNAFHDQHVLAFHPLPLLAALALCLPVQSPRILGDLP